MKASLKFREDQKPLFRAKVPLTILGLPFQSALAAGDSKELTLSLSTLFPSGPSLAVAYRPNDSWNPFSLLLKTGAGPFASPIASSVLFTAQLNLIAGGNPSFMLHFHPRLGDFSLKKSHSSIFLKSAAAAVAPDDGSPDLGDVPAINGAFPGFSMDSPAASAVSGFLSGMEVAASTAVPVRSHAAVRFRWGLRVPAEAKDGVSFRKAPFLVLNKIGIEHVDGGDSKEVKADIDKSSGLGDNGEACFCVKRQFEVLEMENGMLKKAIDDLRKQMKSFSNSGDRRFKDKKTAEFGGLDGPAAEEAAGEELRKALSGA